MRRYAGSLATPPSSQTANWIVLARTVAADAADIAAFKTIVHVNARPLPSRNGRFILKA